MTRMFCVGRDSVSAARFRELTKAVRRHFRSTSPAFPFASQLSIEFRSYFLGESIRSEKTCRHARAEQTGKGSVSVALPTHRADCSTQRASRQGSMVGHRIVLVWALIYLTVHCIDCASLAARNQQEAFWTCKARAVADSFFSRTGAELPGDCAVVLDSFIRVTCFLPFGCIIWNLQILGK